MYALIEVKYVKELKRGIKIVTKIIIDIALSIFFNANALPIFTIFLFEGYITYSFID